MYIAGDGVERDVDVAVSLLQQARGAGHRAAGRVLGSLFLNGNGVPQDLEQACHYLREASQLGDAAAGELLGRAEQMREATASPVETVAATEVCPEAAQMQEATASPVETVAATEVCPEAASLTHTGWTYLVGSGVVQDFDHASMLFRQAWEQGDAAACGLLGWMHLQGLGTDRDV